MVTSCRYCRHVAWKLFAIISFLIGTGLVLNALFVFNNSTKYLTINTKPRSTSTFKNAFAAKPQQETHDTDIKLPTIYIITPTYARLQQKAELTRLSYTLRHVQNIQWIIVEDSLNKSGLVTRFLTDCKVSFTHLNAKTPKRTMLKGMVQRNAALKWIRKQNDLSGVVYFADDDNTYDVQVFEEMRYTKKVSVWPVGLVGSRRYETVVLKDGKVIGWAAWNTKRTFAIDMAGFAINVKLLYNNPQAKFQNVIAGYQETGLLEQLVTLNDLEPKADNCTKVLVWHTRTEPVNIARNRRINSALEV